MTIEQEAEAERNGRKPEDVLEFSESDHHYQLENGCNDQYSWTCEKRQVIRS